MCTLNFISAAAHCEPLYFVAHFHWNNLIVSLFRRSVLEPSSHSSHLPLDDDNNVYFDMCALRTVYATDE